MAYEAPPTLELLAWIARRPRTYREAIETWRSNCPRLSVWEDALAEGLVEIVRNGGANGSNVTLTAAGIAALERLPGA